jgi:PhoPQ-activated pathogenicity-related protein
MRNHHAAYGFWAQSLSDYESQGLTTFYETPLSRILSGLVDPYAFRDRLTMPKCVINATGDQYFTPDSSKFYFDDLPGEKLLYYVPNSDHSLAESDALDTLIAFYASVLQELPRPKIEWSLDDDGAWRVSSDLSPKRVLLWQAVNEKARDFRVQTIGKAFTSRELIADLKGNYVGGAPIPKKGYAAYLVQLEYDIGAPSPLRVSTPVQIVPDTLPFAK